MKIIDGQKLAKEWETRLLATRPKNLGVLAAVLVGENPGSVLYLQMKEKMAARVGLQFRLVRLPAKSSLAYVQAAIEALNADKKVTGIIVQLPLPAHLDVAAVVNCVASAKDVDGLSDVAIAAGEILPATATGIFEMLRAYKIAVKDRQVVLLGFTRLLNVPLSMQLARMGGRVTVLQEGSRDMALLKAADVVITAAGKRNLITGSMVKPGVVVIDAGISQEGKKIYGDSNFESVAKKAAAITPVPGGVGPMTLVGLLANLITLTKRASSR